MNLGNSGSPTIDTRYEGVNIPTWRHFWPAVRVVVNDLPAGSRLVLRPAESPQVMRVSGHPPVMVITRYSRVIFQRHLTRTRDLVEAMRHSVSDHWHVPRPGALEFGFEGSNVLRKTRWLLAGIDHPPDWHTGQHTAGDANATVRLNGFDLARLRHLRTKLPPALG